MTFKVLDPRKDIRDYITTEVDLFGTGSTQHIITIKSEAGNTYQIPIYLTERTKSNVLPSLPFIELGLLDSSAEPHDVGASTRKNEAIIDVNIYWTTMDDFGEDEEDTFGLLISNKFYNSVRSNQCNILGPNTFINVRRTGRVLIERYANQVVYHRNMEIYVLWYDKP
jgi:hypothetical protein